MKAIKGGKGLTLAEVPRGVTKTISTESTHQWLKRLAADIKKQTPHLKTKKVVGIKIAVPINHYGRLKEAFAKSGEPGVVDYCKQVITHYNHLIVKHLKIKHA